MKDSYVPASVGIMIKKEIKYYLVEEKRTKRRKNPGHFPVEHWSKENHSTIVR